MTVQEVPTTAPVTAPVGPGPGSSPRRPLTRFTKVGLTVIAVLALLESVGLGTRWLLTDHRYVITDNAQVDGDQVEINAPAAGIVRDWRPGVGSTLRAGEVVGRIEPVDQAVATKRTIRAPGPGTVARTSVTDGQYVAAGTRLATAYGAGGVYVTARVPEGEIRDVRVGAAVDVRVAAYPGTPVSGVVAAVSSATAGVYELDPDPGADPLDPRRSIYPGPDTDPSNPQRVDQYVPVKILFTHTGDAWVMPGMNVTVHIHRP